MDKIIAHRSAKHVIYNDLVFLRESILVICKQLLNMCREIHSAYRSMGSCRQAKNKL